MQRINNLTQLKSEIAKATLKDSIFIPLSGYYESTIARNKEFIERAFPERKDIIDYLNSIDQHLLTSAFRSFYLRLFADNFELVFQLPAGENLVVSQYEIDKMLICHAQAPELSLSDSKELILNVSVINIPHFLDGLENSLNLEPLEEHKYNTYDGLAKITIYRNYSPKNFDNDLQLAYSLGDMIARYNKSIEDSTP